MLAGDQDLSQVSSVLTIKGYSNKQSLCYSNTKSKMCFKYTFHSGKKLQLVECFERSKITHFLFVSYCRFNVYNCFANQLLEGTVVLM